MNKYYQLTARKNGNREIIFGSFDKKDVQDELSSERDSLKQDGYKTFKIETVETVENPDPSVYGKNIAEKLIIIACNEGFTADVICDDEKDIDCSSEAFEVIDAFNAVNCESIIVFRKQGLKPLVFQCCNDSDFEIDENIIDYRVNNESERLYKLALECLK